MIPRRIKLSGFLCYRDEREISFEGDSLWMLAGPNGSGKSTVFDAVTYALFGYHRGGSTGNAELINNTSNSLAVEFEFELDNAVYQVRRTLKLRGGSTSATQQVLRRLQGGNFEAVPDTQRKTEFEEWIRNHIGLTYDTFTSSVLLLQGRAEKLLDSGPKDRALVLASIVDLQRFQRLHESADGRRKELRGQVDSLRDQFNAIQDVPEHDLTAAFGRIETAEEARVIAQLEADRLQALEFEARTWSEKNRKLTATQEKRIRAGKLVQEAATIERDLARLKELRDVLPHVETIFQRRADLSESESRTKDLADVIRDFEAQLNDAEHNRDTARHKAETQRKQIAADDSKLQEIMKKLPELSIQVERLARVDEQRQAVAKLETELNKSPDNLSQRVADAQHAI